MNIDQHPGFQRMIDESLAGAISAANQQSLREHLLTCVPCQVYLSASKRVIAGLSGFSFEVNPTLNPRVLAALKLHRAGTIRQRRLSFKLWTAFALALWMSLAGSAVVYQVVRLLADPEHFGPAQIQSAVLVFWLLPSFCASLGLLAASGQKRGPA